MGRPPLAFPEPAPLHERLLAPLERFLHIEAASGIVLLAAAALALAWANSPWHASYEALWHAPIEIRIGSWLTAEPLHYWINEALMTIFFLVVGLEIRREMHEGALSSLRLAALPLAAALGGVAVPAVLYLAINTDPATRQGWAVPTATDIAFAVGVLTLLGRRVPSALRVLLLALAIIDDVAAILIIALVYSSGIDVVGVSVAGAGVLTVLVFQRMGIQSAWAYVLPGAIVWSGLLQAGLHPTLAGVVLGLMTPVTSRSRDGLLAEAAHALDEIGERTRSSSRDVKQLVPPLQALKRANRDLLPPVVRVEMTLHAWVAFGVMPLFALANAGVNFGGIPWDVAGAPAVLLGIVLGLVLGKPCGVLAAAFLAVRVGLCVLPPGVNWRGVALVGCLAGIGFTMAIFIANLAFDSSALLATAKLGVLVASGAAAAFGLLAGFLVLRSPPPAGQADARGSGA
ncbi:MAG TPA: Na+/H+ antiporter NhaA [Steroidobacteraceae bacterium]|nr:Na+/H+ antiporter NhaA [Steroidobacteraceae bacterium]